MKVRTSQFTVPILDPVTQQRHSSQECHNASKGETRVLTSLSFGTRNTQSISKTKKSSCIVSMIIWVILRHYPYLSHTRIWGVEAQIQLLLISALAVYKRSASHISQCTSGGRNFLYALKSTAGPDVAENRKFYRLCLTKCTDSYNEESKFIRVLATQISSAVL